MGLLIDSSCLIAVERGETDLSGLPPEARAVSVVTVSELLQGAYGPSPAKAARGLAWLERLLAAIQPLPIDEPVARVVGGGNAHAGALRAVGRARTTAHRDVRRVAPAARPLIHDPQETIRAVAR